MFRAINLYLCLLVYLCPAYLAHAQEISFAYSNYPPYTLMEDNKPSGLFVETINKVAKAADLKVKWGHMTTFDSANILDKNPRAMCDSGRSYTPERGEKWLFVPYSLAFVPGNIVVTKSSSLRDIRKHKTIESLIDDKNLFGIVADGQLYSEPVLKAMGDKRPWFNAHSTSDAVLGLMLERGKAHYAIVLDVSWKAAIATNPSLQGLERIMLEGLSAAGNLYIACTRHTPIEIIDKLGNAMDELGYKKGSEFLIDAS